MNEVGVRSDEATVFLPFGGGGGGGNVGFEVGSGDAPYVAEGEPCREAGDVSSAIIIDVRLLLGGE